MQLKKYQTTQVIIFWLFIIFQYKFELISNATNFVYELPHHLPKDIILCILGSLKVLENTEDQDRTHPIVESHLQKQLHDNRGQKLWKKNNKLFCSCLDRPYLLVFCKIYCPILSVNQYCAHDSCIVFIQTQIFVTSLITLEPLSKVICISEANKLPQIINFNSFL